MRRLTLTAGQLCRNPEINPRTDPGDVKDLAAQIEHRGFADPLWVRHCGTAGLAEFEIIDGSRRLAALQLLWEQGKIADSFEIPCDVFDVTVEEAREMALAANVVRSDLSPADEATGFYRLKLSGMAVTEIAAHFAVPERRVEQWLRLGSLPPTILAALRAGRITLETAQAFTLTPSAERQIEIFDKLTKGRETAVTAAYVRKELVEESVEADDARAEFVGLDAYEAAGGTVTRDLFAEREWLDDEKLLDRLFEAKLTATAQALKDEGWSFVEIEREANKSYKYNSWQKLEPKGKREMNAEEKARLAEIEERVTAIEARRNAMPDDMDDEQNAEYERLTDESMALDDEAEALAAKPFTAGQMKKCGCAIVVGYSGVEIRKGLVRPAKGNATESPARDVDERTGSADDDFAAPSPEPVKAGYSDAAETAMLIAAAEATRLAMATVKPMIAYRMGLAARILQALNRGFDAPFAGRHDDQSPRDGMISDRWNDLLDPLNNCSTFADVLAVLETKEPENLIAIEALLAADLLKFYALGNPDVRFVLGQIDPDIRAAFTVGEEFLKQLSKDQIAALITECHGGAFAAMPRKKPELVAAAVEIAAREGWLPPKLRTPSYTGPGSNAWADAKSEAAIPEAAE